MVKSHNKVEPLTLNQGRIGAKMIHHIEKKQLGAKFYKNKIKY